MTTTLEQTFTRASELPRGICPFPEPGKKRVYHPGHMRVVDRSSRRLSDDERSRFRDDVRKLAAQDSAVQKWANKHLGYHV